MVTFQEHDLKYNDGNKTLHYLEAGPDNGDLMIFMHGWPGIGKTWHHQLTRFADKGFKVVAPDMPGYGKSSHEKVTSDYAQENIVKAMLALLKALGRSQAIWLAHDWGCGTLWTLARTHPQVCKAVCGMTVPYGVLELGVEETIKTVNRDIYPEDEYPYGQWSYQIFYEREFEKATAWFEKDIRGFLKLVFTQGDPSSIGQPAFTSNVVKDGAWFGGMPQPPPASATPDSISIIDHDTFEELVAAMENTGFWAADSWYNNHAANRAYNEANGGLDAKLKMPVLFIEAKYDHVCDTAVSKLAEPQSKLCTDLTYKSIEAGHFVKLEKWEEVNETIEVWLEKKIKKP